MPKAEDLSGRVFGNLIVLFPDGADTRGRVAWRCRCFCGKEKTINGANIRRQTSCGCVSIGKRTHNVSRTRSYGIWKLMISRCHNPKDKSYKNYGARGIKVCDRWHDASMFVADMGDGSHGLTVERIDVNGDYNPENCTWIPLAQQAHNKRNTLIVDGKKTPELAIEYGLTKDIVRYRVANHIPLSHIAIHEKFITHKGRTLNQKQWCDELKIHPATLSYRLKHGWSIERALS